ARGAAPGGQRRPGRPGGARRARAARARPRDALRLRRPGHRRAGPAGGGLERTSARGLPAAGLLRTAGHARHRLLGAAGPAPPPGGAERGRCPGPAGAGRAAGRPRAGHAAAAVCQCRGRAVLHRPRLPRLRAHAAGARPPRRPAAGAGRAGGRDVPRPAGADGPGPSLDRGRARPWLRARTLGPARPGGDRPRRRAGTGGLDRRLVHLLRHRPRRRRHRPAAAAAPAPRRRPRSAAGRAAFLQPRAAGAGAISTNASSRVLVAGSANLDFVVRAPRVPAPGETVLGGGLQTFPGGKGANQAVACARAGGAPTTMLVALGADAQGERLRRSLREAGVELVEKPVEDASGVAFICIADSGENAIVVAPGANERLRPDDLPPLDGVSHLLLQLETPLDSVTAWAARARAAGVAVVLNAAPAQ